ncbi:MAG: MopE-related protein [Polyangiaceae bacterium]
MSRRRALPLVLSSLFAILSPSLAHAADLILTGNITGPVTCPNGGTPVDAFCDPSGAAATLIGCMYGGEQSFDSVSLTDGAIVCVKPFDGSDPVNSGNLVLKAPSILIDRSSRITAKGTGYRGITCGDGEGPAFAPLSGGRGGCSVLDSGGGGGHFGNGGRGTKDCFIVAPASSCQFPQEWEEDCGNLTPAGNACVATADPNKPVCYGTTNSANGAGDGLPTVAGQSFYHSIFDSQFGAAGGDKGCRDGFDSALRAGRGGGRIVLFAATGAQSGVLDVEGRVTADGFRGCASGNDSAGGGGGGTILLIGDTVTVGPTARVSAHGGRGGDSQPKCLPCTTNADCGAGQSCVAQVDPATNETFKLCNPCNCAPCSTNADCKLPGQTCKNLGGDLGNVCADASNQCTPYDVADNERECKGTQNNGTCDDCGGGGGGGIINVQSRLGNIHPEAIFDVRGAIGGICPICSGEAGGGAGELQIDSAYVGEICDGHDNDFNGQIDDGLPDLNCAGTTLPSCVNGVPQQCPPDFPSCTVTATDARPRFAMIVDTSGSMLLDLQEPAVPTFGDGSEDHPGVDTDSDADGLPNNSRLFAAKQALTQVLSAFPESDFALARYYQDVGQNRSCQSASNFECATNCCSYDDPTNNVAPAYPSYYPDNQCVLSQLYAGAGYPSTSEFTSNMSIGWTTTTADCINYAGSCGAPRRGAQYLVGFDRPINDYLRWLDGKESSFNTGTVEGDHCAGGDCELRSTGPTPLAGALEATYDYLTPIVTCDSAKDCRSYATILLTDGAESCQGDPVAAAAALNAGIAGKSVKTYVVGFALSSDPSAVTQLNAIANAGGTGTAILVADKTEMANQLARIIGENQRFEICDGADNDCDTLVDEDFPELGQPCSQPSAFGDKGTCRDRGIYVCKTAAEDPTQTSTKCEITEPGTAPGTEVCNGLDDDCDGLIDENDQGLPLDCGCTPSGPEVCDGVDNDCDGSVDEEPDVSNNDPNGTLGKSCRADELPETFTDPCKAGTLKCVAGQPTCIGFVGPRTEVCDGKDNDCDGVADNEAPCPGDSTCVQGQCLVKCDTGEFPCPTGLECKKVDGVGYCFPITCNPACSDDQVCQAGVCVDKGDAGTAGGASGAAGNGGASGSSGTSGNAGTGGTAGSSAGDSGTSGTTSAGGSTNNTSSGTFRQATGGACSAAPIDQERLGTGVWLMVSALGLVIARRRRSSTEVSQ